MMQRKLGLFLMLVSLLLVATSSVFAQRMAMQPCFGLGDDDCDLYYDFQMAGLPQSTAFELAIDMVINVDGDSLAVSLDATGAYVIDEDAIKSALETFGALGILDVNLRNILQLADDVVSAFDAELSFDLNRNEDIVAMMGGEAFPTIDLWLVDGVAYADLSLISMFMGDPSMAGVFGLDMFELLTVLLDEVVLADLFPHDMMGDFGMMDSQGGFMDGFNQGFMMGAMMDEDELNAFISIVRLEDSTIDGMTVAVFETTVDISALFQLEGLRGQMMESMRAQGLPDDFDADAMMDAMVRAFEGSAVTVTENYDLESLYLVSADAVGDFVIDPAPFAELDPAGFSGDEEAVTASVTFSFKRNNINGVDAIVLPEGAQVVPISALLGGMGMES